MKKYSEKFLNQSHKLKQAVIGFEFEFYLRDLSFYKTLELLNQELSPVKVHGFRQYHSDFTPDKNNFKLEPDLSGGPNLVELITGPLDYFNAKYFLIKILKFIQNYGYTTEKSSIHFNLSFNDGDKNLNDLNILKLILKTDEDEIYRYYPSRKNNVYAKTIRKMIPYKEYDFHNVPISVVKNNLRLPNDKYYGINFTNILNDKETQRLEFRYIGGKDYEKNTGLLIYFLDRFIINVYDCTDVDFDSQDVEKLEEYLDENISMMKNFSKYDNFIVEFPKIQIQIDQNITYDLVSAYYPKIYNKIHSIVDGTTDLKDCIINYVTSTQKIEIVDALIRSSLNLSGYDFINCTITEGIFDSSGFIGCDISNTQITKSTIDNSDVKNSKVLNCGVDGSSLKNCYFMSGYLNSDMEGGVFRSGKLGPYATLSPETKIVTDNDNFFDTTFDEEGEKGTDKGVIKAFGKSK